MTIVGIRVIHKPLLPTIPANGEGIISSFKGDSLEVKFDSGKAVFYAFPDCFVKKILVAKADADQETIMSFIDSEMERISTEKALDRERVKKEKKDLEIRGKFGSAYHPEYISTDTCLPYKEVEQKHDIAIRSSCKGINKSRDGGSIVLISAFKENYTFDYSDYYRDDGKFIYTGAGTKGDQKLSGSNLEITTAKIDGKTIHLYIRLSSEEYLYQGVFEYESHYFVSSKDKNGKMRNEIKFVLRRV